MTREEKIKKRQERAYNRKAKRLEKDKRYLEIARLRGSDSVSYGRRISQGKIHHCEMGYADCELNGCNGDC